MRTKVYGKKTRTVSHARAEYNATLSSETKQECLRDRVLAEKPCNSQATKWKSGKLREEGRAFADGSAAKLISLTEPLVKPAPNEVAKQISKDVANDVPSESLKGSAEDGVARSFTRLEIKDSETPADLQAAPGEPASLSSPLCTQPVALDSATRAYLEPLLGLKHVQADVEAFGPWLAARCAGLSLSKIGEGSFGEVYRAAHPSQTPCSSATAPSTAILKLVPLNAPRGPNSKCLTSVAAAAAEARMLQRMQRVPGFVAFRGACVLRGAMPARLRELWETFRRESGRTVASRDPRGKKAYPGTQLWLLIEMADAGRSLEPGEYEPPRKDGSQGRREGERRFEIRRTWDIWWQAVKAVAKAELYAEFEHRDLHLGNICAKDQPGHVGNDDEDLELVKAGAPVHLPLHAVGVEVTIIDYSLSRAKFGARRGEDDEVLFYDFKADEDLLNGEGDRQYDMYRYMAKAVGERSCRDFVPETNVIWLHHVLAVLLEATARLSLKARASREGFVTKTATMERTLEEMKALTDPKNMEAWEARSAGAILDTAVARGWFSADDVIDR